MSVESKIEALQTARSKTAATKAYDRLAKLFDDGVFTEIDAFAKSQAEVLSEESAFTHLLRTAMFRAVLCQKHRRLKLKRFMTLL